MKLAIYWLLYWWGSIRTLLFVVVVCFVLWNLLYIHSKLSFHTWCLLFGLTLIKRRQDKSLLYPTLWHGSSDFAFDIIFTVAVDCCCIFSSINLLVKPAQIKTSFMQCKWRCTQHHACASGELQNIRCCNPAMFFSLRLMQLVIHCSIYKKM